MDSVPTIALPLRTAAERREAARVSAAMPMEVDGRPAVTQDLSATGLSFASDRSWSPGDRIDVVIEYLLDGHHYPFACKAEVVRVEPHGQQFRVAARLLASSGQEVAQRLEAAGAATQRDAARHLRPIG